MTTSSNARLAVLVDADNAQAAVARELMAEVARYGTATVKRAYGDWTTPNLGTWKGVLHDLAIQPVQQFRYTTGKNATDSALIIDAMDLLHGGKVDGFCIVSSDSDFTRLATRIREAGMAVYGFGEKKTPKPFVAACDKFTFTEILRPAADAAPASAAQSNAGDQTLEPLHPMLCAAVTATAREDGWAALSAIGSIIGKNHPSFDERNYGFKKLGELVRAQPYLDVKSVPTTDGSPNLHVYVRLKQEQ